jgi:hypothetical protein
VHEILGLGPDCSILAHLSRGPLQDPLLQGHLLHQRPTGRRHPLCCVPLDKKPHGAGDKPVFGAPVMGLARPTTIALPVKVDLLGETPEQQQELYGLLCDQIAEMYSPPTDKMGVLSTSWQPCAPPDALPAPLGAPFYQTECCWAYDHPDHTTMAVAVAMVHITSPPSGARARPWARTPPSATCASPCNRSAAPTWPPAR